MTKYINKVTGAELDYDKVHEDFERSLLLDHGYGGLDVSLYNGVSYGCTG